MAGDPFTSAIFRWLNAVAADQSLPRAAFKLAYVISQHINRQTLDAWPSQTTLAEAVGVKDERSVRRLTESLQHAGFLLTRRRKQTSMVYRLAQDRAELSYQELQNREQTVTVDKPRPDIPDRSSDQDRTFLSPRPDIFGRQDRTELSAKPLKEPLKEPVGETRTRATLIPDDFSLSPETYNLALQALGSNRAVDALVNRFVNHHRQVDGKTAKSRDWDAKFRIWVDQDTSRHQSGAAGDAAVTESEWRAVLETKRKVGRWTKHTTRFGPEPGHAGCIVPEQLLTEFGYAKGAAA